MNDLRHRLDHRVDDRLNRLRQRTNGAQQDEIFVEQVMLAVNGHESIVSLLGAKTTRRSLLVCCALVGLSLVWAAQAQSVAASAMVVTNLTEAPW